MSDVSPFDLVIDGEALHFNGKIKASEAMAIEAATGMTFEQWGNSLQAGSITAMVGLIWLLKRRTNPSIKYSDIDFDLDSIEMPDVAEVVPEVPTVAGEPA